LDVEIVFYVSEDNSVLYFCGFGSSGEVKCYQYVQCPEESAEEEAIEEIDDDYETIELRNKILLGAGLAGIVGLWFYFRYKNYKKTGKWSFTLF
jgi:hypothetical protein